MSFGSDFCFCSAYAVSFFLDQKPMVYCDSINLLSLSFFRELVGEDTSGWRGKLQVSERGISSRKGVSLGGAQ